MTALYFDGIFPTQSVPSVNYNRTAFPSISRCFISVVSVSISEFLRFPVCFFLIVWSEITLEIFCPSCFPNLFLFWLDGICFVPGMIDAKCASSDWNSSGRSLLFPIVTELDWFGFWFVKFSWQSHPLLFWFVWRFVCSVKNVLSHALEMASVIVIGQFFYSESFG